MSILNKLDDMFKQTNQSTVITEQRAIIESLQDTNKPLVALAQLEAQLKTIVNTVKYIKETQTGGKVLVSTEGALDFIQTELDKLVKIPKPLKD